MLKILASMSLSVLIGCLPNTQHSSKSLVIIKSTSRLAHLNAQVLEANGYDVAGVDQQSGTIEVVTENAAEVQALEGAYQVSSVIPSEPYAQIAKNSSTGSYYNPEQSKAALEELESSFGEWTQVIDLNAWLDVDKTVEGRSLYALQVSSNPGILEDRPRILIIGNHHARELMTHHAVIDSARDYLTRAEAGEPEALHGIDNYDIWFVPVVNPDGLAYVFSDERMWRKNRSINRNSSAKGVDLNRNYEFKWGECGSNSSSASSDIFKGFTASSEPEVQAMDALNQALHAEYVISYHSSGNEILYPFVCGAMTEHEIYYGVRDNLVSELSFGKRVASSTGEDFEHHYARYGSISFLLEIGTSFQPNFDVYESTVKPTIVKVLPILFGELEQPLSHVKVVEATTGAIISGASLSVAGLDFAEGEVRKTDSFGVHRWRLVPGSHQLSISAPGFKPKTLTVQSISNPQIVTVELERQI